MTKRPPPPAGYHNWLDFVLRAASDPKDDVAFDYHYAKEELRELQDENEDLRAYTRRLNFEIQKIHEGYKRTERALMDHVLAKPMPPIILRVDECDADKLKTAMEAKQHSDALATRTRLDS